MQEKMITITEREYAELQEDSALLNCLRNAGVDNLEGYEFALEEFHELGGGKMSNFKVGDKVRVMNYEPGNEDYDEIHLQIGKVYTVTQLGPWKHHIRVDDGLFVSLDQIIKVEENSKEWNPLTVEELQQVCDTMPGGIESFCKGWGWLQFAQEVEKICREKNS